jgi:hypothetical protein
MHINVREFPRVGTTAGEITVFGDEDFLERNIAVEFLGQKNPLIEKSQNGNDKKNPATSAGFDIIADTHIVSEDYQNELMMLRGAITTVSFRIGDIANEISRQSAAAGLHVTDTRVFHAIGRFCGKSARTVRYYAETAAFFSYDTRTAYEVLPFSHFVFARSMGDRWMEVLDRAMLSPNITLEGLRVDLLGLPASDENSHRDKIREISRNIGRGTGELETEENPRKFPETFEDDSGVRNLIPGSFSPQPPSRGAEDKIREISHDYYRHVVIAELSKIKDSVSEIEAINDEFSSKIDISWEIEHMELCLHDIKACVLRMSEKASRV